MKRNVPKLRFKGFSDEWEERKLGEIISSFEYGMNSAAKEFDGENKYIRITDIDEKSNKYLEENKVSPEGELEDKYIVKDNDILFARTGASTGKTYLYDKKDGKLYFAGFLIRGNVNRDNNSKFIFLQTQTNNYHKWVKIMSMRSGQPGINSQEYSTYSLCIPSLEEQEKIANFLTKVDKIIEKQEEKVTELEKYKKGMMQKIFSQEIRFNDENGGEYPEWEFKNIEDICEVKTGGTPSRQKKEYWENGTIYWMVSGEVNKRIVNNIDTKITLMGMENSAAKILPIGTVMIALNGQGKTKGTVALLNVETTCNQSLAGFIPNETFNSKYLFYNLQGRYREIRALAGDGERNGLNLGLLREILVQLPSLIEQEKISKFFYKIDSIIEKEKEKLEELRVWKKGLLQGMFV